MMSNMVEAGWLQQYDYDKLMTLTEAAQVCHAKVMTMPIHLGSTQRCVCETVLLVFTSCILAASKS